MPKELGMCEANDTLIYNSLVELEVKRWDEKLTEKCVSKSSGMYGKKFKEIYEKAGCDFYKIDEGIFAPAKIKIKEVSTAKTYEAGI
jgi:methenyltetrahydromethanopterin cyclohydrolase